MRQDRKTRLALLPMQVCLHQPHKISPFILFIKTYLIKPGRLTCRFHVTGSKNRPLTLRDVSEASNVSEMTVSRVLRGRGDVSETTRERVLKAAKELGYVPNKIAGALASQKVNLVAVVIPSMSNMVFPEVMTGVNNVLEGTELQPVVGITNYMPEKEEKSREINSSATCSSISPHS